MRDFKWNDTLWAVVKDDGKFAGVPCRSFEEARDLSAQHENSVIMEMQLLCTPWFDGSECFEN